MGNFLKFVLDRLLTTLITVGAIMLDQKAKSILDNMSATDSDSGLAVYQLLAARVYDVYGLPGLRTLYEHAMIPDYLLIAYIVRDRHAARYPEASYIPDTQPNVFKDVSDITNDPQSYRRILTFLDGRDCIDYDLVQKALK